MSLLLRDLSQMGTIPPQCGHVWGQGPPQPLASSGAVRALPRGRVWGRQQRGGAFRVALKADKQPPITEVETEGMPGRGLNSGKGLEA